jgi:hypothetical protein
MNKVKQIGYFAQDEDGNLYKFQWQANCTLGIYNTTTKAYEKANADDYEILEIGYFHDEVK